MSTRLELIKRYLAEDPSDSFLRYALALEFIALNDKQNGFDLLLKLIDDDPDYLASYYTTGKCAEELGQLKTAENLYQRGIEVAKSQKDEKTLNELSSALELIQED